jgi:hypothetical protein
MQTIEIDFEVFKALTARRRSESMTYNDTIRELLGLARSDSSGASPVSADAPRSDDWTSKGVRFPAGTEFRANYKGTMHFGRVEGGRLLINEQSTDSPSDAARLITGNNVNGWTFWECRFPGDSRWRLIKGLRSGA